MLYISKAELTNCIPSKGSSYGSKSSEKLQLQYSIVYPIPLDKKVTTSTNQWFGIALKKSIAGNKLFSTSFLNILNVKISAPN